VYNKEVQQTADGGYIIIGSVDDYTYASGTGYISLVKTDSLGNMLWTKNYNWSSWDLANSIRQTADGGYVLAGDILSGPKYSVYLVKTNANGLITALPGEPDNQVSDFHLFQNYPNPFNPVTTISYALNKATDVNMSIYYTAGKLVNKLISTRQSAGYKSVRWAGINNNGNKVSSGIYICVLNAGNFKESLKIVLLK
jgi:hypothetical protein